MLWDHGERHPSRTRATPLPTPRPHHDPVSGLDAAGDGELFRQASRSARSALDHLWSRHGLLYCGAMRSWALRSLIAGALVAAGCAVSLASPSHAARACSSGYVNTFDGKYTSASSSIFGVRARIEKNNINLCGPGITSSDGGVSAWSMLSAPSASSNSRINFAQVGYTKTGLYSGYGIHETTAFAFNTTACYATFSCGPNDATRSFKFTDTAPPNANNFYAVYLNSGDDRIKMVENGVVIKSLNFDVTGKWGTTWFGQYFGETFDRGDDIMGSPSNHTSFDYLQWYGSSGGLNFFGDPSIHEDPVAYSRYQRSSTNPSSGGVGFDIWTDPS